MLREILAGQQQTCSIGDGGDCGERGVMDAAVAAADDSNAARTRLSRSRSDCLYHFVVNMAKLEAVLACYT